MLLIDMFLGFSVAIETSLAKSLKVIPDPMEPEIFDIIIKNGTIYDGTGAQDDDW